MRSRGLFVIIVAATIGVGPAAQATRAQTKPASTAKDIQLPRVSYVCTMPGDEDVVEDQPGPCRRCGMMLAPIRLDSVWTCARQPLLVVSDKPGTCPADGTPFVQVTAALSWTCKDALEVDVLQPGTCADGSPMIKKYSARAHGNHNPQHGGQFFMAPDGWHHLEGTLRATGVFRAYLYDDFTKPLAVDLARGVSGVVVVKDAKSGKETPVALARNGRVLEAKVGRMPFPAQMYASIKFTGNSSAHRFDFTFEEYSKEPKTLPTATSMMTAAIAAAALPISSPATIELPPGVDPALVPTPIPESVPEILAQLKTRDDQVRQFIEKGMFAAVYVPAFQAKDLALALDGHAKELSPEQIKIAEPAIARVVRSAYLLDAFGDLGNKQEIVDAYARFNEALKAIESAFPGISPR